MKTFENANFPMTQDGRTYHVGTCKGETANRIITVGDPARAERIAGLLDEISVRVTSKRGFTTITGLYKGTPVSIVSIGMGISMMDFFLREVRATIDGPMYCIRLGSCGSISEEAKIGNIVIAESAVLIQRNVNAFSTDTKVVDQPHYSISLPFKADEQLTQKVIYLFNRFSLF